MAVNPSVLIAAGGTGGHVFPGLAVAKELVKRGYTVHWLGTTAGIEASLVPDAGLELHIISIKGVRGRGIKALVLAPFLIVGAVRQALRIVRSIQPSLIIGMGGFVAGPGGLAAKLAGVPLLIHEQNAVAGTTNKLLSTIANQVLVAFPGAFPKAKWIGNPVRQEFYRRGVKKQRGNAVKVLVVGGSRGARALNELVAQVLSDHSDLRSQLAVYHQTGEKLFEEAQHYYGSKTVMLTDKALSELSLGDIAVKPFISDMAAAFNWADLVVCRAGALTISELAASGVASILVPFPFAIDDHQAKNANYLVEAGAAVQWSQNEITSEVLATQLGVFVEKRSLLEEMGSKALLCAKPNAVEEFAQSCEMLIQQKAA
ncbi:UDP-N-acetylglucosamine-N-acetylmuramylpentapeptide N-acetylglucosamine transferase [Alteromonadaceae bacterium Bs31]|nr:UDP-N-acetylglucosamine-N-acetylmuramylpentapeptide N-acetylglucosamine transferase [Alteromonadaceae bacterium Bs31]